MMQLVKIEKMKLANKEIVLGVTGGIACYKSPEIIRQIRDAGGHVSVIMTQSAMEFVTPLVFQAISERPVATSLFSLEQESKIGHINISEKADAMLIAPATANIIGKAANGIADDFLSTALLACKAPLFIAPAMNHNMWDHEAVQQNLNTLKNRHAIIIEPESGYLACGSYGTGRMAAPNKIVARLLDWFESREKKFDGPLTGIKVLITAGPTREKIDAVRYLSNYSSGKMGYALAKRCRDLGADVCLVSGPTSLNEPEGIETIHVTSAEEMGKAVFSRSEQSQLIIKAAAVSDFRLEKPFDQKIKKTDSLKLALIKNEDILKELGKRKTDNQFLVGFAAESQNVAEYARTKLIEKNLDLVIANNILEKDAGFDVNTNRVIVIDHHSKEVLPLLDKATVAERVLDHILSNKKWQQIAIASSGSKP